MSVVSKKDQLVLILLAIAYSGFKVCADRYLVHVPESDHMHITKHVFGRYDVLSLAECAGICDIVNCRVIKYDETSRECVAFGENEEDNTPDVNYTGKVYITQESKSCSYPDYKYIWELDICVKYYYMPGEKGTWEESQSRCEREDGNLIIVSNQLKNELFIPYLNEIYAPSQNKRWWIGANDKADEGVFRWVSGENMTYQYWDFGQPDNFKSLSDTTNADCAQFFFRTVEQSFAWFDITCDSVLGSVCENRAFT